MMDIAEDNLKDCKRDLKKAKEKGAKIIETNELGPLEQIYFFIENYLINQIIGFFSKNDDKDTENYNSNK